MLRREGICNMSDVVYSPVCAGTDVLCFADK